MKVIFCSSTFLLKVTFYKYFWAFMCYLWTLDHHAKHFILFSSQNPQKLKTPKELPFHICCISQCVLLRWSWFFRHSQGERKGITYLPLSQWTNLTLKLSYHLEIISNVSLSLNSKLQCNCSSFWKYSPKSDHITILFLASLK